VATERGSRKNADCIFPQHQPQINIERLNIVEDVAARE
jgi:hypothetical protein